MMRYYITDRHSAGGSDALLRIIAARLDEGIDLIQIREKDLPTRDLAALVQRAMLLPNPQGTQILVNSRTDIALACGAHGVHLPAEGPEVERVRSVAPPGFLVGVSTHNIAEVTRAGDEGADFLVFGPVFFSPSKPDASPVGIPGLQRAVAAARIPVFALGGVTAKTAPLCAHAGAAGIAGISMFQA